MHTHHDDKATVSKNGFMQLKVVCADCGWCGLNYQILSDGLNYKILSDGSGDDGKMMACPKCDAVERCFYMACDEPECWNRREVNEFIEGRWRTRCKGHSV